MLRLSRHMLSSTSYRPVALTAWAYFPPTPTGEVLAEILTEEATDRKFTSEVWVTRSELGSLRMKIRAGETDQGVPTVTETNGNVKEEEWFNLEQLEGGHATVFPLSEDRYPGAEARARKKIARQRRNFDRVMFERHFYDGCLTKLGTGSLSRKVYARLVAKDNFANFVKNHEEMTVEEILQKERRCLRCGQGPFTTKELIAHYRAKGVCPMATATNGALFPKGKFVNWNQ